MSIALVYSMEQANQKTESMVKNVSRETILKSLIELHGLLIDQHPELINILPLSVFLDKNLK